MADTHKPASPHLLRSQEKKRYQKALLIQTAVVSLQALVVFYVFSLSLFGDTVHGSADWFVIAGSLVVMMIVCASPQYEAAIRLSFAYIGIMLLVVGAFYILYEAYERLHNAVVFIPNISVLVVALLGGCGNFWVYLLVHCVPKEEHTHTHSVFSAHVFSDLLISVVVIISWFATFAFGWTNADSIFSVGVAGYMLFISGALFNKIQNRPLSQPPV